MASIQLLEDYLNIDEILNIDDSVEGIEFREYESQNPGTINNKGQITIDLQSQDLFMLPSESYLLIEGDLLKHDNTRYANTDITSIINNGILFMFHSIKYQLNNNDIETINNPGQATTMKNILLYPAMHSEGLDQCWAKDGPLSVAALDTNLGFKARHNHITTSDPIGGFSFAIPLANIFGFCEGYKKVIYGCKHSLLLSRTDDNDAIYRPAGADLAATNANAGKIILIKLAWVMPHVKPALEQRKMLYKIIEKKTKISIGYNSLQCEMVTVAAAHEFTWRLTLQSGTERPRWIIVGFQTEKNNHQLRNPAVFNHLHTWNIYAQINGERFPSTDLHLDFTKRRVSKAYRMLTTFKNTFYNKHDVSQLGVDEFISTYPLFVLDVSKQAEHLKNAVQDIIIKAEFSEIAAANTMAYVLLISDRILKLQSDGQKFSIVY